MIVRKAQPADAGGIAAVHVDSWRETYRGIVPDSYLDRMSKAEREQKWKEKTNSVIVAEIEGQIAGFVHYGPERSGSWSGFDGEIYALYIRKQHHRQGAGLLLFEAAGHELGRLGLEAAVCCVLTENRQARCFYEKSGGELLGEDTFLIDGVRMHELIYGWRSLPLQR
ncbi:N-acetyltransferase family protein [Alkalicoccus luteus]|uniref:N-acetyltransferase family protein n=1 Tax=Alkalicoccus luteus TaxID=1237094 RepID=UPI004033EB99